MFTTKCPKKGTEATVDFNFGASVEEKVSLFGANVVNSTAEKQMVVQAQALVRRRLEADEGKETIQEAINSWKPGLVSSGKSKREKAIDYLAALDPDARKTALADLKKKLQEEAA